MSIIKDIIARVDENRPNAFSSATKMKWISDLDGKIAADVFLMDIAQIRELEYRYPEGLEKEPLVTFPHDDIYDLWLEAKIDAANGEYNRYQNTMQIYNESYSNFVQWFASVYEPAQGGGDCCFVPRSDLPTYYLTAYGIAVKRGFVGSVDEWLASLKGEKGDPGTDPEAIRQAVEAAVPGAVATALDDALPTAVRKAVAKTLPDAVRDAVAEAAPEAAKNAVDEALPDAVSEALKDVPEPKEENDAVNKAYVDAGLAGKVPASESEEYPGCYFRTVDGVTEWLNPPMVAGVEYRTTERINNKPVYAMVLNRTFPSTVGSLSSYADLVIDANLAEIKALVRTTGAFTIKDSASFCSLPYLGVKDGAITGTVQVTDVTTTGVRLRLNKVQYTYFTALIEVYYTKE